MFTRLGHYITWNTLDYMEGKGNRYGKNRKRAKQAQEYKGATRVPADKDDVE
jgi:hypothetical protein